MQIKILSTTLAPALIASTLFGLTTLHSAPAHAFDFRFGTGSNDFTPLRLPIEEYIPHALEKGVIWVTSDVMDGSAEFRVELNAEHSVTGLRFVTSKNKAINISLDQFKQGAVLRTDTALGKTINTIVLKTNDDFDPKSGGSVKMIYVYSGVPWSYEERELPMQLRKTDTSHWEFQTGEGQTFNSMYIAGNFQDIIFVGRKLVGIDSVTLKWDSSVSF